MGPTSRRLLLAASAVGLSALGPPAQAAAPHGPGRSPLESPQQGPLQVCEQMLKASRDGNVDDLIAHTSVYARERFNTWERFLVGAAHNRLAESRCVRVLSQDGDTAQVLLYAPNGNSAPMPFLKEEGVWRFDQQRWEQLRGHGAAPQP
jgi:hypothetical protein